MELRERIGRSSRGSKQYGRNQLVLLNILQWNRSLRDQCEYGLCRYLGSEGRQSHPVQIKNTKSNDQNVEKMELRGYMTKV